MFAFQRILLAVTLVATTALFTGCPGSSSQPEDKPKSQEEFWVIKFKGELQKTEQRFFEQRYILNAQDPFYLQEILPKLSADTPPSKALKAKIDTHKEDFDDSWPLLTSQLERTQLIFTITSVLPAFQATALLGTINNSVDVENASMILSFRQMVEGGAVFNTATDQLDIAPQAKTEIVELAGKIAVRTLKLLASASAGASGAVQSQLSLYRNEIRLLNPVAADAAGQGLTADEIPYTENPLKLWADLKQVYDSYFGLFADMTKLNELNATLAGAKTQKQKKALKTELTTFTSDVKAKLATVPALRAKELALLQKLQFATEKQFSIAKTLTKTK